jgi:hypothetical protein
MDISSDFRVPDDRECLHILTHIAGNFQSWMLAWCRRVIEKSSVPLKGFYLSRLELFCLGIDWAESLSQEMENAQGNSLVRGTEYYKYMDEHGNERAAIPGEMVMGTYICGIHFKSEIDAFPYELIFIALRRICRRLKVTYEEYLPMHYGEPCEDLQVICIAVLNHECDSTEIAQNIHDLRIRLDERIKNSVQDIQSTPQLPEKCSFATEAMIKDLIAVFSSPQLHDLKPSEPFLHCGVDHDTMAKLAKCSIRTLHRRNKARLTSLENPWVPPHKISRNCVMYKVSENLETIQLETPRFRNIPRDCQLRDEIRGSKYSSDN